MKLTLRKEFERDNLLEGFKSVIHILSVAGKPFSSLTEQEKYLVAIIMFYNDKYKALSKEERKVIIFSPEIRKEIQSKLNIQKGSFNNLLHSLRKKEVLIGLDLVPVLANLVLVENNSITFNIDMK